jgi:hypothetical protein
MTQHRATSACEYAIFVAIAAPLGQDDIFVGRTHAGGAQGRGAAGVRCAAK